jgi:DNA mismatch endonuclease (patch repair protein)
MDRISPERRSANMAAIRGKDTKPELTVRRVLHALGFRFRVHRNDLPGRPDIVLPRYRAAILVHGCFWHLHDCRVGQRRPTTNGGYWKRKREGNAARDAQKLEALVAAGWRVRVIWECEIRTERFRNGLSKWIRGG